MKGTNALIWLKIALVVSLALNSAFLVKTLFIPSANIASGMPPSSGEEIPLRLSSEQRSTIRSIMAPFRLSQVNFKQKILDKRIEIIESLGDEALSPGDLSQMVTQLNTLENELNQLFVKTLAQISSELNPGQRMQLLLRLSRGWFFHPGGPGGLRRSRHGRQP